VKNIKNKDKTKVELLQELEILRKEREKGVFKNIFEYKEAEKGLKEPEEEYQKLFENMMDGLVLHRLITDKNGHPVDYILEKVNKAAEKILSWNRKDIEGKKATEVYSGDTPFIERYAKIAQTGKAEYFVDYYSRFKKWYEINSFCPKKGYFTNVFRDITERKEAEKALADSEEKYRTVFENTGTATIIIEEDKIISMVNTQSEKMYGYSKEEIENKMKWTDFVIAEDLERMKKYHIARRKAGGKAPTEYEFRLIDKKGNIKDILLKIGMLSGTKKSVASLMDITERKQTEEKIKHLNLILRAIRSVNQLIVKEKDRERLLQGVCNNLIETGGYYSAWVALLDESGKLETYAEAGIGKAILPMVEILKKGEPVVCGQKALKQQEVVTIKDPTSTCPECPLLKQHSGRRVMTVRLEHDKKIYGFVSVSIPAHIADDQEERSLFKEVAEDIAFSIHNIESDEERKQAEENLKNAKDELQMMMDSVPAIIFYKDTEGRIVRVNKTYADSLKMPVKDMVGKTTEELFPKEQAENMRKDDKEVMISGKPKRDIIQPYDTPEGTRWAITDKMPYKDTKGKIIGIISLSKDITVQRKSEKELQQSYQRLKKTMDAAIDTMSKIIL
jgi:PAS domain S-box-containing protein